tara:strand:- start:412 stop:603 length:192 start_codon:yes stop_codon:yes gene_type:complete
VYIANWTDSVASIANGLNHMSQFAFRIDVETCIFDAAVRLNICICILDRLELRILIGDLTMRS